MAKPNSRIIGFDALAKQLTLLSDVNEIGKVLRKSVGDTMNEVKKVAAKNIPIGIDPHKTYKGRLVAPGFAKRSLRVVTKLDKRRGAAYAVLGVRAEAFYAIQFIELGTYKMPAHPWLRPAFESSSDKSVRMVGEGMKDWIRGIADKHRVGTGNYTGGADRVSQLLEGIGE